MSHIKTPDDRAIHSSTTRITIHRRLPGGVGAINMKRVAYTCYLIRVMWRRDDISVHSRRARWRKSAAHAEASLTRVKIHSSRHRIQLYYCGRTKIPYIERSTGCPFSYRFLDGFRIEFPYRRFKSDRDIQCWKSRKMLHLNLWKTQMRNRPFTLFTIKRKLANLSINFV